MKRIDWLNRVYLCYEEVNTDSNHTSDHIKGFICYRYNSFETADSGWNNDIKRNNYLKNARHTMIPICRWVPNIFDRYILNLKLRETYWLGKHIIYKPKY